MTTRSRFALGVLAVLLTAAAWHSAVAAAPAAPRRAAAAPQICNNNPQCPGCTCPTTITSAQSVQPADACPLRMESQSDMDIFAWNSFLAMNWPANPATCTPNPGVSILSGQGPTVWETFAEDSSVFVRPPATPAPWCSDSTSLAALPKSVLALARQASVRKVLHYNSKSGALGANFPGIAQAVGGVLTDQNGRFVRYEVTLNRDEYNYLTANQLWSKTGQGKMTTTISFPTGPNQNPGPCNGKPCGPVGAMEIKSAWKVLSNTEIKSGRFYMTRAIVYNDDTGQPSPGPNPVAVGLVGLHILHKTASNKNWFWATFEQADNTTTSFFNPACSSCQVNTSTVRKPYKELAKSGQPLNQPVQVTRLAPIEPDAAQVNTYYRHLLQGSVWANYQLISLQWTTGRAPKGTPPLLANTTLETYNQKTSSCFGCHQLARTTAKQNADFSFLLGNAQ